ncbi:liprin-alpha-2-like isoform X1 [Corythoichthys intestinalis]|uniref:liprin-alpha-2-like isoform X1 n=1 Tax=Corythoichthys intestinalis TaxID=161448 RepID=UPI0025A544B8|nr:liprin-alpha-2-like isoform X1 [Corythoichthys intestinalis]
MDVLDENMTAKEVPDKIAELDKSRSQLHLQNTEMKNLLGAANDEMTALRSENDAFRKRVDALEQTLNSQRLEAQLVKLPMVNGFDVRQSTRVEQQELQEDESNLIKEENAKLTAKVRRLQVQREQDKKSLSEFSVALQNIEREALQQKDEFIEQNKLQLKQAEETVEEYSNIIKDLRETNQLLRSQLEDREDEALLATYSDSVGENEASHHPVMTFAEEIMLLVAPVEMKSITAPSMDSVQEDTKAEELTSPPANQPTNRCTEANEFSTRKMYVVCMVIITILLILATAAHARNLDFLPLHSLWRSLCRMLQPYFSVHYGALPPI